MSIKYSEDHEWVDEKEDDLVVIGITDFAQEQLGDLVYVELPEVGDECSRGENISVIESVKAASDLVAPVSGSIIEVNSRLEDEPEIVTEDSMGEGWFIKVKLSNPEELNDLMDEDAYNTFIEE
ncbi:glycine cleavage system protein GcvH [Candidatus Pseudothioglobus singularis]|jgi:glycine cleavage system H protein|uniref:Glycine cleavage system H protein n=1 Tax=Candidatus Pseudothioglobus singularis PS1 TaxID=1125411 RepID=A0A0M4L301_9GAMM|nr:glycine cleavage system protein GcvH [Candidatus Pseudothioglobus singularis]MDG1167546.1 glycine cleavage system protein GcvH [Candidatus Thioglobus sp.]ALE01233.1 glycine cleavage system protein H [Candidatus Pseudothioglobus singularis PS1]ANQ65881.1 glycine cleavage system protein H [Candidatus Pseudothioglobus singularis]MDA7438765.1 glycine cleavage system protein GcvH [Candidatus Pseudothioglobus singularis]MDA7440503.1 glycine cleavage system protein GcvH [Candidatus Pseudothioglobu|tara:strand:- start:329 stop:700 length:372 start_codon:yes stop_codon:yes gene_type:complete